MQNLNKIDSCESDNNKIRDGFVRYIILFFFFLVNHIFLITIYICIALYILYKGGYIDNRNDRNYTAVSWKRNYLISYNKERVGRVFRQSKLRV